ncbi:MAG: UTP--glucose-1-phosphate uridylyltransferase [Nannocystaceae bacterium]|nr:UTP--glucose-1-phosphate uridylyltransferase [Nannocystaceae bacterium]
MQLRPSVAHHAFDRAAFDALRARVGTGALDPAANRLPQAPTPLTRPPIDLRDGAAAAARTELGLAALRAGKVAVLVLNGGMATRFGGGAKGVVPVVEGNPRTSFLAIKLAEVRERAKDCGGSIPVVLMHSFATEAASVAHVEALDWAGVAAPSRLWFSQSIMPRVLPDGTPLASLPEAQAFDDQTLYAAPGHGDTLGRLVGSGVLAQLRERGVEHILVSNVDNVGASLDPLVLGAHLQAVREGAAVSVEVVRRIAGDAGGCVAELPGGRPAIIEGFRLPQGTDLADYPHFNTNTLWLVAAAMDRSFDLSWFAVRKQIAWPGGGQREVVQFEQLIGQVTEFVPTAFLDVDRDTRFLPIKTREDLAAARPRLESFARAVGLAP